MTPSILWQQVSRYLRLLCIVACLAVPSLAGASEQHGQVVFGGLPVPGATVTATQGSKKFVAVSDAQGRYSFPDLPDGTWRARVRNRARERYDIGAIEGQSTTVTDIADDGAGGAAVAQLQGTCRDRRAAGVGALSGQCQFAAAVLFQCPSAGNGASESD